MRVLDAYPWIADRFANAKDEGERASADCPLKCHRTARVRFWCGRDGRLMFGCYGGCSKLELLRAVKAGWPDCFPGGTVPERTAREMVATYRYRDEDGRELYQVVRFEPGWNGRDKDMRPRYKDETTGAFVWGLPKERRRVLYRLPELLAAPFEDSVFVVAGEKDCDTLAGLGLVATTNVFGESTPWQEDYSRFLADRHVAVIEDRDSAGKRHTNEACGSLLNYAASLRRCVLPAKDATALVNGLRMQGVTDRGELRDRFLSAVIDGGRAWQLVEVASGGEQWGAEP